MNISIVCVGKLKESFWQDAAAEYIKRLGRFCNIKTEELAESRSDNSDEESYAIIKKLKALSPDYIIALDVGGKALSSEGLAEKIADLGL